METLTLTHTVDPYGPGSMESMGTFQFRGICRRVNRMHKLNFIFFVCLFLAPLFGVYDSFFWMPMCLEISQDYRVVLLDSLFIAVYWIEL